MIRQSQRLTAMICILTFCVFDLLLYIYIRKYNYKCGGLCYNSPGAKGHIHFPVQVCLTNDYCIQDKSCK